MTDANPNPAEGAPARKKTPLWQVILPWLITIACFAYLYTRLDAAAAREGQSLPNPRRIHLRSCPAAHAGLVLYRLRVARGLYIHRGSRYHHPSTRAIEPWGVRDAEAEDSFVDPAHT